jgi:hypothetical protein
VSDVGRALGWRERVVGAMLRANDRSGYAKLSGMGIARV